MIRMNNMHGRRGRLIRRAAVLVASTAVLLAAGGFAGSVVSGADARNARSSDQNPDLNGDGVVDDGDVAILKSFYGQPATTPGAQKADLNSDGVVNITDLSILLSHFTPVTT